MEYSFQVGKHVSFSKFVFLNTSSGGRARFFKVDHAMEYSFQVGKQYFM
jgi:hypothetical protein